MELKRPTSMKELVAYTRRNLVDCKAELWVFKEKCPSCGKGLMEKPKKTAKEYLCNKCGHGIENKEYEKSLTANIKYTCHHCNHNGQTQVPYVRKGISKLNPETGKKITAKAVQFLCEKCGGKINVTKKLK